MIALEGPDNAGKSTLAKAIGFECYTAGPAPNDLNELAQCLLEQRDRASVVCVQDRLTCVSQQVYSPGEPEGKLLDRFLAEMMGIPGFIVVYCRPPDRILMDLSKHKIKSYDTEESQSDIVENQHLYIRRYDELMEGVPHFVYDWTEYRDLGSDQLNRMIGFLKSSQTSMHNWSNFQDIVRNAGTKLTY